MSAASLPVIYQYLTVDLVCASSFAHFKSVSLSVSLCISICHYSLSLFLCTVLYFLYLFMLSVLDVMLSLSIFLAVCKNIMSWHLVKPHPLGSILSVCFKFFLLVCTLLYCLAVFLNNNHFWGHEIWAMVKCHDLFLHTAPHFALIMHSSPLSTNC